VATRVTVAVWRKRDTPACCVDTEHDDEGAMLSKAMAQTGAACVPGRRCIRESARSTTPPRRWTRARARAGLRRRRATCALSRPRSTSRGLDARALPLPERGDEGAGVTHRPSAAMAPHAAPAPGKKGRGAPVILRAQSRMPAEQCKSLSTHTASKRSQIAESSSRVSTALHRRSNQLWRTPPPRLPPQAYTTGKRT
jgi:hypothetical protein